VIEVKNLSKYIIKNGQVHELSDDELMHWKYIKREKVNGKWRYYYDVGDPGYVDGNTGKKPSNIKDYSLMETLIGKDEKDRRDRAITVLNNKIATLDHFHENPTLRTSMPDSYKSSYKSYKDAGRKYTEAQSEFMKTPLGKIEKAALTIKKAKKVISNWFSKLGSKLGI